MKKARLAPGLERPMTALWGRNRLGLGRDGIFGGRGQLFADFFDAFLDAFAGLFRDFLGIRNDFFHDGGHGFGGLLEGLACVFRHGFDRGCG